MTIKNAIKKLEKFGKVTEQAGEWRAVRAGYEVSFLRNGRGDEATCYRTRRVTDHDDSQSDYFAGSFWPNITQAIAHAGRMIDADGLERAFLAIRKAS
jgi:hypothetical protein